MALARALAIEPQVLLLDEPLSALDAKIRIVLRKEIRAIQRQLGITTVYVTHDQEEALSLSDRVVVMSEGRIEQIGTPFEIYNFPSTAFVASFVGTLNLVAAGVIDAGAGRLSLERPGDPDDARRVTDAGSDGRVTLAVRPGGDLARRRPGRRSNRLRGTIDGHQLPGLDRPVPPAACRPADSGDARDDDRPRHVQRAAPRPCRRSGRAVTVSFPHEACFVLGSASRGCRPAAAEVDAEV